MFADRHAAQELRQLLTPVVRQPEAVATYTMIGAAGNGIFSLECA